MFLELLEAKWGVFGLSLLIAGCLWIAWIDPINQQTTIRDYLKPGSYETLPTKTNFSRLGI
ncbi:hypothetical protein HPCPY1662_1648 [Helicobacter pylori CPY1662]|nr:hypothetical protein HPCPY1313_0570 [Helicobacter pylori CPY1313]EJB17373.1 hypothetical protein HPCPY6081_1614 [Helicobacter pylori CPY6081]EMR59836.1 hypothetical protein HPCPY1662_1648 [Helicobacter pylori CPY1662]